MSPIDPGWLELMFERGLMDHADVIGVHGFPETWEKNWTSWNEQIQRVQDTINRHASPARIWITEVGYSTRGHREFEQGRILIDVLSAPVERIYWYSMIDLPAARPSVVGLHTDERDYHCGLCTESGRPKLLYRLWASGGLDGVQRHVRSWRAPQVPVQEGALVTGGAGFIGANLAARLLDQGRSVVILDNLSRHGVERNLAWLQAQYGPRLRFIPGDIRDPLIVRQALRGITEVYHLAAQVVVTTSLADPQHDFSVNAAGTLNLLEGLPALRGQAFNIGGGPGNSVSLTERLDRIAVLEGERPQLAWSPWRASDQRYYVSDTRRFSGVTGWSPRISGHEGIARLHAWLAEPHRRHRPIVSAVPARAARP